MKRFLVVAVLFLTSVAIAQVENSKGEDPFYQRPAFFYDMVSFVNVDSMQPRVDMFVQVPFASMQFLKKDNVFEARYSLTATIFDEFKLRTISERTWTEKVTSQQFEQTRSDGNFNLSLKSFNLLPGNYAVRLVYSDRNSNNTFSYEGKLRIKPINTTLALTDVIMVSNQNNQGGSTRVVPNVSGNVANQKELPLFYEIYSDEDRTIEINYLLNSSMVKNYVYNETVEYTLKKGLNQIFHTIDGVDLSIGDFTLMVNTVEMFGGEKPGTVKTFFSRWIGLPSTPQDLDDAIDQMVFIAPGGEISKMEDAETFQQKLELFIAYWKTRDPSPSTKENELFQEYYRRINYANKHFKQMLAGWRTDMGMVYVILGPPDSVERHPFEYDSKPYEIWEYYHINRRYVFVDNTGFGDYRLTTPFMETMYR